MKSKKIKLWIWNKNTAQAGRRAFPVDDEGDGDMTQYTFKDAADLYKWADDYEKTIVTAEMNTPGANRSYERRLLQTVRGEI